jgi:uncharacterized protein with GYD domain
MPTYTMLATLTSEGAHTVHANSDRLTALADGVSEFGCKVVAAYALPGRYYFVTIVEAPDNETVAHLSVDLGSHPLESRLAGVEVALNVRQGDVHDRRVEEDHEQAKPGCQQRPRCTSTVGRGGHSHERISDAPPHVPVSPIAPRAPITSTAESRPTTAYPAKSGGLPPHSVTSTTLRRSP